VSRIIVSEMGMSLLNFFLISSLVFFFVNLQAFFFLLFDVLACTIANGCRTNCYKLFAVLDNAECFAATLDQSLLLLPFEHVASELQARVIIGKHVG
jgi:hypothetical protein